MTEHRLLTGAQLHEPKGAATAPAGQVYVSNGSGSGVWTDRFSGLNNLNKFSQGGRFDDISSPSSVYVVVSQKANLIKIAGVLNGPITGANNIVTVYKNGVTTTASFTVPFTGSTAGSVTTFTLSNPVSVAEGDLLELRSDGASSTTANFNLSLTFTAVA